MKAILRTNVYDENYRIVDVIKNPFSENNHMALINENGIEYMTGGILVDYNETTIKVLDTLTPEKQWDWLKSIKVPKCGYVK